MEVSNGMPKMKVWEEGEEVIVWVRVPGIDENNIVLEVKDNSLKIDIKEEFESTIENEECVGEEWESSSFSGVVSLPCKVVPMLVHHSYDGEVLEVRLKKA